MWAQRGFGSFQVDLVGGSTDDGDALAQGRVFASFRGGRAGVSAYCGRDTQQRFMRQTAVHLGYSGHGVEAVGQLFEGRATGGNHRGWTWRVGYRLPMVPLSLFSAQTGYRDGLLPQVTSTRVGAQYRLDAHYRCEVRYEFNHAPAPAGDNRFVLGAMAVF